MLAFNKLDYRFNYSLLFVEKKKQEVAKESLRIHKYTQAAKLSNFLTENLLVYSLFCLLQLTCVLQHYLITLVPTCPLV